MRRGLHRTYEFARRALAVHARHRLEVCVELSTGFTVVTVDAYPVHLASTIDFLLADHRNVVLGLAGYGAGIAADAGIEVDDHPPLVPVMWVVGIQCVFGNLLLLLRGRKARIAGELFGRCGPDDLATLHPRM